MKRIQLFMDTVKNSLLGFGTKRQVSQARAEQRQADGEPECPQWIGSTCDFPAGAIGSKVAQGHTHNVGGTGVHYHAF